MSVIFSPTLVDGVWKITKEKGLEVLAEYYISEKMLTEKVFLERSFHENLGEILEFVKVDGENSVIFSLTFDGLSTLQEQKQIKEICDFFDQGNEEKFIDFMNTVSSQILRIEEEEDEDKRRELLARYEGVFEEVKNFYFKKIKKSKNY